MVALSVLVPTHQLETLTEARRPWPGTLAVVEDDARLMLQNLEEFDRFGYSRPAWNMEPTIEFELRSR